MATILGSYPSLSRRLCQVTTRCLHTQTRKQLQNPPSLSQLRRTLHSISKRIVADHSTKSVLLVRPALFGAKTNIGDRYTVLMPLLRQGNNVVYVRFVSGSGGKKGLTTTDAAYYVVSLIILFVGFGYAGVPLFKMFCRQFGLGGDPTLSIGHDRSKVATMEKVDDREITVRFSADKSSKMQWNFKPQQTQLKVKLGETALAFFQAENPTDKPIVGIATYSVSPYVAAPYFNKIQCFCFEEQILNPHETVDMPVFFYIDPDYDDDFELEFEDNITLAYTFFQAKDGMSLPLPGFMKPVEQAQATA